MEMPKKVVVIGASGENGTVTCTTHPLYPDIREIHIATPVGGWLTFNAIADCDDFVAALQAAMAWVREKR